MRFPPEFIERLRHHFLMSEVVGKRVPLKRHGREYMGLCPFHKEKSPSFTVNDEKGFFHCFGCGAHGDAIGFVKDFENLGYVETIERLANEAGMALPQRTPEAEARMQQARNLHDAMEAACRWFAAQLESAGAMAVRDYLGERGIDRAAVAQFRLGFAPADRNALRTHLLGQQFTDAQMIEAGLLIPSDRGQPFSRFTERLMFPIADRQGRVIAFGGRVLPGATATSGMASAKYVNSPDTPLFHKGQVLYNFAAARRAAKEAGTLVVGEGYMDIIALSQAGVAHAVAPLGTALTEEHLRQLWQTVAEPVLCLDGDAAGQRAMMRAAEMALPLLQAGQGLRFALLPEGQDPDSLLRAQGPNAVTACLEAAIPLSEALWNHAVRTHPPISPEARAGLEKFLMTKVDNIQDASVKRHFRQYVIDQLRALSRPAQGSQAQNHAAQTAGHARGMAPASGGWSPGTRGKPPASLYTVRSGNPTAALQPATRATAMGNANELAAQGFVKGLLCLLAIAPELLDLPEIEEDLHRIPGLEEAQGGWLSMVLADLHVGDAKNGRDALARMKASGFDAWSEACQQAKMQVHARLQQAAENREKPMLRAGWRMYMIDWEEFLLGRERIRFEHLPVEESFPRMLEFQQQMQRLQRERAQLQAYLDE